MSIDKDHIEHFCTREHLHTTFVHFFFQRLVAADQQLLSGLATSVKGARYLSAAERTVVEQATIFTGERNSLRHALVNDVGRNFGETMHVGLTTAEVTAFDRIIKQTAH